MHTPNRISRWWHPFGYILKTINDVTVPCILGNIPVGEGRVLDYGCGEKHLSSVLPDNIEYIGADLIGNQIADVHINSDGTLPIADEYFDLVISTQVLEHVEHPDLYLKECHRVLKPGGKLILSTHGLMFYHAVPTDYRRWTADGLNLIINKSGLHVSSVKGIVGLVPTAIWLVMFNTQKRIPRYVRQAYVLLCNFFMCFSDRLTSDESRMLNACVYLIVANRK